MIIKDSQISKIEFEFKQLLRRLAKNSTYNLFTVEHRILYQPRLTQGTPDNHSILDQPV